MRKVQALPSLGLSANLNNNKPPSFINQQYVVPVDSGITNGLLEMTIALCGAAQLRDIRPEIAA